MSEGLRTAQRGSKFGAIVYHTPARFLNFSAPGRCRVFLRLSRICAHRLLSRCVVCQCQDLRSADELLLRLRSIVQDGQPAPYTFS